MIMNHVHWQCEVWMKWFEMIELLDLPSLTSIINTGGYGFTCPRSAVLESRMKLGISIEFRYSKS